MTNNLKVAAVTYTRLLFKNTTQLLLNLNDLIYFLFFLIESSFLKIKSRNTKFKIITASDSSHFKSLCQLLDSLTKYCRLDHIVLYDLGLTNTEVLDISKKYPCVKTIKFNFGDYPKHVNLKERDAGAYAWKPIIIYNEYQIDNLPIIWMDAGNIASKNLQYLKRYIVKKKFYSPYSSGNIQKWTHPDTLLSLEFPDKYLKKRNLNGALIGLDQDKKISDLLENWYAFALKKEIIIPDGSSRLNHRQDQSLLTLLFYSKFNFFFKIKTYKLWGVDIQQDID